MSAIKARLDEVGYGKFVDADNHSPDLLMNLPALIGSVVPDDYFEFLMAFPDTGMFDAEIVCVGIDAAPCASNKLYPISLLYASCSDHNYDLLKFRATSWELPEHFLVIGDDVGGNYFCLDLRRESFGNVYFLFHEEEIEEGLYLIANNFTSFINGLQQMP